MGLVTANAVSSLATSLVLGWALQALVDPDFDPEPSLNARAALLQATPSAS